MIRVTVWNENIHDRTDDRVKAIYPLGIHGTIARFLNEMEGVEARTATLDQPSCGLTDGVLDNTDVLIWWAHAAHHKVPDELAVNIRERVNKGMGFIALHSAHLAKPFKLLMGTSCTLRWREGDYERLWCVDPGHPIAEGIPACIDLECEEMYGEFFDIPHPESLVFNGWFSGGELFRSGCCWTRGFGRVFYFQPGHETNPTYHNPHIQRIICNAVRWAAPRNRRTALDCPTHIPVEKMENKGQDVSWY
jgi:trehalose utilization protein